MIVLDLEQGSDEWLAARAGIPTASMFSSIITPTGKSSTSREGYMRQLAGEWLIGGPDPDAFAGNYWMKRGSELEGDARSFYEFMTDNKVDEVGIVYMDESKLFSCSPDGLVGEDGGWENKTPKLTTHVGYLEKGELPATYKAQVQGSMWITGRKWWDFMSYHPDTEPMIVRVERDDEFIGKLSNLMYEFLNDLAKVKEKIAGYRL